jgi:hypothetical protein
LDVFFGVFLEIFPKFLQDVSPEKLMALFQQAEQMECALKQIEALGKAWHGVEKWIFFPWWCPKNKYCMATYGYPLVN